MSQRNPTPLQVGMSGSLAGRTYRVAGRIVMCMDDAGETYYWNEFYLKNDAGEEATLVFEETETGGAWRLFTMFEPDSPMTAREAAAKRVGDSVRFEDRDLRVTLVDESRVDSVEGEAPEGVERGDVARYFNAEGANRMFVVSWTGEEVECYRGADLSPRVVADAFGLPHEQLYRLAGPPSGASFGGSMGQHSTTGMFVVMVIMFLLAVIGFVIFSQVKSSSRRAVVIRSRSDAVALAADAAGMIAGRNYRVTAHRLVEIAQVGRVHERHEFELKDAEENSARLICGLSAEDRDWWLFTPLSPIDPMTPAQAAQVPVGRKLVMDGYEATVTELFRSRLRPLPGAGVVATNDEVSWFGFTASTGQSVLLTLWNQDGIQYLRGQRVEAKAVLASFQAGTPLEAPK